VRASILSLFAPARVIALTAFGFANTTPPTCGSMIRAIPSAFPVASSATSSSARDSPQTASTPPARSAPARRPHRARLRDRHLAEVAMHV
jgi:hypothetical protein